MPSAVLPIKGALSAFHGNAKRPDRVAPGTGRCGIRCREMLRRWFSAAPTSTHYRLEQTTCQGVAGKSSYAPPDRSLRTGKSVATSQTPTQPAPVLPELDRERCRVRSPMAPGSERRLELTATGCRFDASF